MVVEAACRGHETGEMRGKFVVRLFVMWASSLCGLVGQAIVRIGFLRIVNDNDERGRDNGGIAACVTIVL